MTDADLNEAIGIAWTHAMSAGNSHAAREAFEHLETLREAQRRRAQDQGSSALEAQLKESREAEAELFTQLEEAKEAAARADKTAEGLYQDLYTYKDCAEKRLMKIRRQEQTIQTQQNTISCLEDDAARLRGELGEANRRNDQQRQLIQTLREKSATALLQRMRDDVEEARDTYGKAGWTRGHLLSAFDTYEREFS